MTNDVFPSWRWQLFLRWDKVRDHDPDDGTTLLHGAAAGGNLELVKLLLEKGAELESRDHSGLTPLAHAAWCHQVETARYLMARGAKPDIFICSGIGETACVKSMLERDKTLAQAVDRNGNTPLHWVCAWHLLVSIRHYHHQDIPVLDDNIARATIDLLLAGGAAVDAPGKSDLTPLHLAIFNDDLPIINYLIERGARTALSEDLGSLEYRPRTADLVHYHRMRLGIKVKPRFAR